MLSDDVKQRISSGIAEVNKLGVGYKETIYRDFLGIEPPQNATGITLK